MNEMYIDDMLKNISEVSNDDHDKANAYSAEILREQLIIKMQEVNDNIKKIRYQLSENESVRKSLLVELRKNEKVFNDLVEQIKNIDLSKSVDSENKDVSVNDKLLEELDEKIIEKNNLIEELASDSGLERVDYKKKENKLRSDLERLKNKRGVILSRQRRIVNSKLDKYYRRILNDSKAYGEVHASEELRLRRNNIIENIKTDIDYMRYRYNHMADSSSDKIVGSFYKVGGAVSYASKKLLEQYCKILQKKDGVLNSFRVVDDSVLISARESYNSDFRNGSRSFFAGNDRNVVSIDKDTVKGPFLFDPYGGTNIEYIAKELIVHKSYGRHCFAWYNGIVLDNMMFNSIGEIVEYCNSYIGNNSKKVSK